MKSADASKRVAGIKQTCNAVKSGVALCVYIAHDADPNAVAPVFKVCTENGITPVTDMSKHDIAKLCHINVPCAASAELKD